MSDALPVSGTTRSPTMTSGAPRANVSMLTTLAGLACAVQALLALVVFLVWPDSIKGWPAQYLIMPLALWLTALWLVVWKPELGLFLALVPQFFYGKIEGDHIRVRNLFALKLGVALALLLALGLRKLVGDRQYTRVRTPLDRPMLALFSWGVLMMVFGVVRGNPLEGVLTAANDILQIPVIYFLLTVVMFDLRRLTTFVVVLAVLNTPLALYNVFSSGRGGG